MFFDYINPKLYINDAYLCLIIINKHKNLKRKSTIHLLQNNIFEGNMTETTRTTVTLNKSYMRLVEDLVDVFGPTKAQVISNIVEYFFNDNKNDGLLDKLRARKRKENPPNDSEVDIKINNFLSISDKIPFNIFVEHLRLDFDYAIKHLDEWAKKYNFKFIDNKIIVSK